jgi:hypothetical protein
MVGGAESRAERVCQKKRKSQNMNRCDGASCSSVRGPALRKAAWSRASWILGLLLVLLTPGVVLAKPSSLRSVPDLEAAMYATIDGWPCVRLLTIDGEIGCSNPGRQLVIAPIQRLAAAEDAVLGKHAVLLLPAAFEGFMQRLEGDPLLSEQVAGVLLEADNLLNGSHALRQFSPSPKFPQAEWADEVDRAYQWNPPGSDIARKRLQLPVYLLSENGTR